MLLLLVVLLGLLLLVAAAGSVLRPPSAARLAFGGSAVVALGLLLLGVAALLRPYPLPAELPLASAGMALTVALDGLSGWFLALLGGTALPTCTWALGHPSDIPRTRLAAVPLLLAGMVLTVVAADGVTLLLGFQAAVLAAWVMVMPDDHPAYGPAATVPAVLVSLAGATCMLAAVGLMGAGATDLSFAALRAVPPEGAGAVIAPLLALSGVLALLVAPLQARAPASLAGRTPAYATVLVAGALGKVAIYLLARLLLDLGGPANAWWGLPLVLLGAAGALLGAAWGLGTSDLRGALVASTAGHAGLLITLLGLIPLFRAADLQPLAALAAGALLLHALARSLIETLGVLVAGQVERTAGSGTLNGLGGLVHAMPRTAVVAGVALLGLAALPPGPGFASAWVALQALLAGWRGGGVAAQVAVAGALTMTALALSLGSLAAVRWFGLAFLGRPRTPRAMGARDAAGPALVVLSALAVLSLLGGLFPGPLLTVADPALRVLTDATMEGRVGVLAVRAGDGMGAYLPPGVGLLLGGCIAVLVVAVRATSRRSSARGPAWDGGFAASPPHLPFGDPACQPTAAGLAQPARRLLALPWPVRAADASASLARLHAAFVLRTGQARDASARQAVGMILGLVLLLAILARLGGRA